MSFRDGKRTIAIPTATGSPRYTVPASRRPTFIHIGLTSIETDPNTFHTPQIYVVPQGQSISDPSAYEIWGSGQRSRLYPGETRDIYLRQFLEPGDFIDAKVPGGSADKVNWEINIVEEAEDQEKYINVDCFKLQTGLTSLRVVAAGRQCTFFGLFLHNTDTSDRVVTLHDIDGADVAGDSNIKLGGANTGQGRLRPGETLWWEWNPFRIAGHFWQIKADVADKVNCKACFMEELV